MGFLPVLPGSGYFRVGKWKLDLRINQKSFCIKCHKTWSGRKVYHDDDAKMNA